MTINLDAPVLELRGVGKSYGRRRVLEGLDLSVRRGEVVGLLGPNGSGKTSTLRIAAGYLWPDQGAVVLGGVALTPDLPALRQRIGYLPERVPLYDPLTVERYLAFVAAARGITAGERRAAIERALAAFDLQASRGRIIGQLSKGYRQRVGLAQAVLGEPELLLLDEPTNGLDPFQIVEARRLIANAAQARAVIFSTHIMQEVEALCTRVVYLDQGRLLELPAAQGDTSPTARIEVEVESDDLATLCRELESFEATVEVIAVSGHDSREYSLRISMPQARRAALVRLLAERASLRRLVASGAGLEQRLSDAITRKYGKAD